MGNCIQNFFESLSTIYTQRENEKRTVSRKRGSYAIVPDPDGSLTIRKNRETATALLDYPFHGTFFVGGAISVASAEEISPNPPDSARPPFPKKNLCFYDSVFSLNSKHYLIIPYNYDLYKFGWSSFDDLKILALAYSQKELDVLEGYFMRKYDSLINGYNTSLPNTKGISSTLDCREEFSEYSTSEEQ